MRSLVGSLGVVVLVAVLGGACSTDIELEGASDGTVDVPIVIDPHVPDILEGGTTEPPRTLSFGEAATIQMLTGDDTSAPVAVAVKAIRRGDDLAVLRARRAGATAARSYYVDVSLTFEGVGVVEVVPFLTLAQGSRETNIQHLPMPLVRPFAPCPGTGDGVHLRPGERVDTCVVFPGPRPDRVRGVAMIDAPGAPTWEGPVS